MTTPHLQADFMEFLRSKSIAVISTVSSTGQPEAATIYFTVHEDFNFYFMTKNFTRKYANLEKNPEVALVIGTENEPVTAQIQGKAQQIVEPEEYDKRIRQLQQIVFGNKYVAPLFQLTPEKNEIVLYKVIPTWIRWLDLREGKIDGDFIQILP